MSGIFGAKEGCAACPSKDAHIAFLQAQVRELQDKLVEIVSPGSVARLNYKQPERTPKDPRTTSHSPRALATLKPDRPAERPGDKPQPLPRVSEDDFEVRT